MFSVREINMTGYSSIHRNQMKALTDKCGVVERVSRNWPSDISAEKLEFFASHLSPSDLPTPEEFRQAFHLAYNRVSLALSCLDKIVAGHRQVTLIQNGPLLLQFRQRYYQELTHWCCFIMQNMTTIWSTPCEAARAAVATVMSVYALYIALEDAPLAELTIQDRANVEAILAVFTFRSGGTTWEASDLPHFIPNTPGGCPNLKLLLSIARSNGARKPSTHLFDIVSHPDTTVMVCDSLMSRLEILGRMARRTASESDEAIVARGFQQVFTVMYSFCESTPFLQNLLQSAALGRKLKIMEDYFARKKNGPFSKGAVEVLLTASYLLWRWGLELKPAAAMNNATICLINAGFLRNLMNFTTHRHAPDFSIPIESLLSAIGAHSVSPMVMRALSKVVKGELENELMSIQKQNGPLNDAIIPRWTSFLNEAKFLAKASSLKVIKNNLGHCSNISCPNKPELRSNDMWVLRSMRRFYFSVVESLFNRKWTEMLATIPRVALEQLFQGQVIMIFDAHRFPANGYTAKAADYTQHHPELLVSPYLQRTEDLLFEVSSDLFSTVKIAEGRFIFTADVILYVLVRLELHFSGPGEDNSYRLTTGMIRMGSRKSEIPV
ncbi:hypothetical protein FA15DRAFT_661049 [Coprinopsis marcescibilis]|uniref:Uncharacterized protein n=1 Tax=Coprinopsis marcescibilis TaxID=230819 RepID=A0A5C3KDR2_COPMA|nr:hypothetical protein FA15DRAFT_661049 [Coprinopsis marcescibilis]